MNPSTKLLANSLIIITLFLAGCKTSPPIGDTADDQGGALNPAPSTNSETTINNDVSEPSLGTFYLGKFHLFDREVNGWDESGWSVILPSEDSRLIYVSSSSGNDTTGLVVSPSSVLDINDPSAIKPFKTIEAALRQVRNGYPDWILLRRGDKWSVSEIISVKGGRSVYERAVITSYGSSSQRPMLLIESKNGLRIWSDINFVAIVGLALYAEQRDPVSSQFLGWGNVDNRAGIYSYQAPGEVKKAILLEDNDINYFSGGITLTGEGSIEDVVIRRNIVRNSYSELSHSQGFFASNASVLLEENIFDHNGWYKQQIGDGNDPSEGQATFFNHNTYFSGATHTRFVRNIFLRSSSIHNKWTANSDKNGAVDSIRSHDLWMEGNVYVGGEIGISAGGNTDHNTGPRWKDITIQDNFMLAIGRDQPTNRNLGWYIEANDWDGGLICGNYLLNNDNASVNNLVAINLSGHSSDVSIVQNTIYGLKREEPGMSAIKIGPDPKKNITVLSNSIQLAESKLGVLDVFNIADISFNDNAYSSGADPDQWFQINGSDEGFDSWVDLSKDINSTAIQHDFSAPPRSFETYLSLVGSSDSIDDFIGLVVNQSRMVWRKDLTAEAITSYLREGYGGMKCSH